MLEALAQWSKARVYWTLGLGYLAAVEIASWPTSRIPPCVIKTTGQYSKNAQGNECPTLDVLLVEGAAIVFEKLGDPHYLVAFATVALFIVTGMLWAATKALVKSAERTAERQLRSYVYIKEGHMSVLDPAKKWEATITIRNFGQTPALETTVATVFFTPAKADSYEFPVPPADFKPAPVDLGPGQETHSIVESNYVFTAETLAKIKTGEVVVFILGHIRYRDIFGATHFTNLRLYSVPGTPNLNSYKSGNDSG